MHMGCSHHMAAVEQLDKEKIGSEVWRTKFTGAKVLVSFIGQRVLSGCVASGACCGVAGMERSSKCETGAAYILSLF